MIGRNVDDQHLLLFVLMERLGGTVDVTQDELADARRKLDESHIEFVSYPTSRLADPWKLTVELRVRPNVPPVVEELLDDLAERMMSP